MVRRMFPKTLDCSRGLGLVRVGAGQPEQVDGRPRGRRPGRGIPISSSMGGTIRVIEVSLALEVHR